MKRYSEIDKNSRNKGHWLGDMDYLEVKAVIEKKATAYANGELKRECGAVHFALIRNGAQAAHSVADWTPNPTEIPPSIPSSRKEAFRAFLEHFFEGLPIETPTIEQTEGSFLIVTGRQAEIIHLARQGIESALPRYR